MKNNKVLQALIINFGLIISAPSALAEETDESMLMAEEIIVTGVKQNYKTEQSAGLKTDTPLINIPQTVSVITLEQIRDQAIQDVGDITRYTPGITISQGEGHRDAIVIRGQRTTADFFLDGVRDDVQYYRPLYNLEQVEIHKGPNALIFGRGSGAGNINRVTKTPNLFDRFVSVNSSVDSFGAYQFSVDGNTYINDNVAVRLNALAEEFDNHRDFFDGERYAFNPTIAAKINDKTRVQFSYEYVDDDRVVDRGIPSIPGGTRSNPSRPISGFEDTFFGSADTNQTTLQAHILRGRLFHDFNENHSMNLTLHYADYDKLYQNLFAIGSDIANNFVSLDGYQEPTKRENFIAQLNFLSEITTGPIKHELLYGFEYGNQQTENARRDTLFAISNDDQVTFAFTDPLNVPAFSFTAPSRDRNSDATFLSVFLQDQITLNDYFQIVGGVRVDRFDIDVVDQIEVNDGAADGNDGFLARVDTEVSPRVGLIFKPKENVSIYASYSQSFLPRSGDQFLSLSATTESLQPEVFTNYEAGVKWDLLEALSFTSSVFRLERDSGTTVDPANPANTILISSITDGIEFQLLGQLTYKWSINAGYSLLDGQEDGRVVGGVETNRALSEIPKHTFSLWNRYDVTDKFGLGLGLIHQSEQFTSISNNVELPSFTRVDVAAYYALNSRINLQLNVENLFDEDYFPASHNDNNISTGKPINARLSVSVEF